MPKNVDRIARIRAAMEENSEQSFEADKGRCAKGHQSFLIFDFSGATLDNVSVNVNTDYQTASVKE